MKPSERRSTTPHRRTAPQRPRPAFSPARDPEPVKSPLVPLPKDRGVPITELIMHRVQYRPLFTCADCRHLGEPTDFTDHRGRRSVRRACLKRRGTTGSDWPICEQYEARR